MFIEELFTITKIWKLPKCPSMPEWIKKCVHIMDCSQISVLECLPFEIVRFSIKLFMEKKMSQLLNKTSVLDPTTLLC